MYDWPLSGHADWHPPPIPPCLENDCPENGKAPFLPLTEKGQDTHNRKSPVTSSWRLRWRVE